MTTATHIPSAPGTYVLALGLAEEREIVVGARGRLSFGPGLYLYVGSARGPGGLAARLDHHLRCEARVHWHVDYLRRIATPMVVWFAEGRDRRECRWAGRLSRSGLLSSGPSRFGASDCRCRTHLLRAEGGCAGVITAVDETLRNASRRSLQKAVGPINCVT